MKINGKNYEPIELTFNTVCDLEDRGVSIADIKGKSMSLMRAYAALSMRMENDAAGQEIQDHIIGGGDFKEVADAFGKEVERSGFFQALSKKQEAEAPAGEGAESKKA